MSAIILLAFHLVFSTNPVLSGRPHGVNWPSSARPESLYCLEPNMNGRCLSEADAWLWGKYGPGMFKALGRASHDTLYVRRVVLTTMYRDAFVEQDVTWWLCGRGR